MNLKKIIFNTQNRFDAIDDNFEGEGARSAVSGVLKSLARGAFMGAIIDYMVGGGTDPIYNGAIVGSILDTAQNLYRLNKFWHMNIDHPNEYNSHKQFYKDIEIIE